jgi:hypothetical protein
LPPRTGNLWRNCRDRGRRAAADVFQGAAVAGKRSRGMRRQPISMAGNDCISGISGHANACHKKRCLSVPIRPLSEI